MQKALRLTDILLLAIIPIIVFFAFYNPAILDPTNFGWLIRGTDNGENALGLHAWQNDAARGWSLRTNLLNAPDGVSVLFTDSNPLLTIIALPLAKMLGSQVQFVGLWVLLCYILHAVFSYALLKSYAPSRLALWIGVALFMLVPTFHVRYIHANLQAHWLILWALWVFIDDRRARDVRWWLAILAVTTLIHNYMLLLVAAIWASALLRQFLIAANNRERMLPVGHGIVGAALVLGIISMLGIDTDFVSSGMYGHYGMPLDALWNASNPTYSALLPTVEQLPRRAFEGFQYLGAGILMMLVLTPLIIKQSERPVAVTLLNHKLLWLAPACFVLTLLAISHSVAWSGRVLFDIPIGQKLIDMLDPIRASSRLFWPVTYVLVLFAVTTAYRLPSRTMHQLLGVAALLQIMDMTGMALAIRGVTAEASDYRTWKITTDPRWDDIIAASSDISFVPPEGIYDDLGVFQEIAWRAVNAQKPVRVVYAARNSRQTDARLAAEYADFEAGRLVPDRLYVLFKNAKVPDGSKGRLITLHGVRVLAPVAYKAK